MTLPVSTASRVRQVCYASASLVGLVLTWYFNLSYRGSTSYLQAWFANAASSSAAVDLLVLALAMSVFMVAEGHRLGMRFSYLFVIAGLAVAMAFAVPLFLLYRERVLAAGRDSVRPGRPVRPVRRPRP